MKNLLFIIGSLFIFFTWQYMISSNPNRILLSAKTHAESKFKEQGRINAEIAAYLSREIKKSCTHSEGPTFLKDSPDTDGIFIATVTAIKKHASLNKNLFPYGMPGFLCTYGGEYVKGSKPHFYMTGSPDNVYLCSPIKHKLVQFREFSSMKKKSKNDWILASKNDLDNLYNHFGRIPNCHWY